MATRKKSNEKKYIEYRKNKKAGCDFCGFGSEPAKVLNEYDNFWIVENIFGYDLWDSMTVVEHLMIVPKKHTESIGNLGAEVLAEYGQIIADYDKLGYSFYARAAGNKSKSIPHQHTHLLKFDGKRKKFYMFLKKPYILWYR